MSFDPAEITDKVYRASKAPSGGIDVSNYSTPDAHFAWTGQYLYDRQPNMYNSSDALLKGALASKNIELNDVRGTQPDIKPFGEFRGKGPEQRTNVPYTNPNFQSPIGQMLASQKIQPR